MADVAGRYVRLHGNLDGRELCILTIYAPISDDYEFFAELEQELLHYAAATPGGHPLETLAGLAAQARETFTIDPIALRDD
ncbi:hypothetical protein NDU88_001742 [Pleurodeles waltl]|uniref:Uncharacterized protein n=1 Tax=Pleurodeles waltl TaxID=8319 RepID=A0AAV7LZF5_PLEWA|nr:hypothetical protein NDU88_001742 [Pleurodeles waltl]